MICSSPNFIQMPPWNELNVLAGVQILRPRRMQETDLVVVAEGAEHLRHIPRVVSLRIRQDAIGWVAN